MTRTRTHRLLAVVLLSAAAFAGCGDDNESGANAGNPAASPALNTDPLPPDPAPSKEEQKAAKTPDGLWAKEMCKMVASQSDPVQPPDVKSKDPKVVADSLSTFFETVSDQMGDQISGLEKVGAPPAKDAKADWEATVKKVKSVQRRIKDVATEFGDANPSSQKELDKLMQDLGKQMQTLMTYEGPVAQLLKSDAIQKALLGNPECRAIGGTAVS